MGRHLFVIAVCVLQLVRVERRIAEHVLHQSRLIMERFDVISSHVYALVEGMVFDVSVNSFSFSTSPV